MGKKKPRKPKKPTQKWREVKVLLRDAIISQIEVDSGAITFDQVMGKLGQDIKSAAINMTQHEGRYLVDLYYQIQDARKAQCLRIMGTLDPLNPNAAKESNKLLTWMAISLERYEDVIRNALGYFAKSYAVGKWLNAVIGIGPVISAGLLCELDVRKAPVVHNFWSFAGMDPNAVWLPKTKRPWNGRLKTLCAFKCGESWVKCQNNANAYYSHLFTAKKTELTSINEAGQFGKDATKELETKGTNPKMQDTDRLQYWKDGKLCPQHIHDRARRWTVKLFLSHLHEVMYWDYYGKEPPKPYVFTHPEQCGIHLHKIQPPHFPAEGWPGGYTGRPLSELYAATDKQVITKKKPPGRRNREE